MHSIEELERQWKWARATARQASEAEKGAADRLREAKGAKLMADFEAMGGVVGVTRVRAVDWNGRASPTLFLVSGWVRSHLGIDVEYKLAKIKKDGTPSNASPGVGTSKVIIRPEDQPNA